MKVLDAFPWIPERFSFICCEQNGAYAVCDCPLRAHKNARLRLAVGSEGRLLLKCMRGCSTLEMLRAVGLSWKDCFPDGKMPDRPKQDIVARYHYRDEDGELLYSTLRLEPGRNGRDKEFRQRRPCPERRWVWNLDGVRRVLYRLPELTALPLGEPVVVVGGEKDADTLHELGVCATTNVCGERAEWLESYSAVLSGRDVVVVQDNDGAGRRHCDEVCGSLMRHARSLRRGVLVRAGGACQDATAFTNAMRAVGVTAPRDLREYFWGAVDQFTKWEAAPVPRDE